MIPVSLVWLLIAGIVLFAALLIRQYFSTRSGHGFLFPTLFVLFFGYSLYVTVQFFYPPAQRGFFDNTDYHVLEHRGFRYQGNQLALVSTEDSNHALFSQFNGEAMVKRKGNEAVFEFQHFYEPLYVTNGAIRQIVNIKNIGQPFASEIQIALIGGTDISFYTPNGNCGQAEIRVTIAKSTRTFPISNLPSTGIRRAVSFRNLLLQANVMGLSEATLDAFRDSYIVRSFYNVEDKTKVGELYFLPGASLQSKTVSIWNEKHETFVWHRDRAHRVLPNYAYSIGVVELNQSKKFKIHTHEKGIEVEYIYPYRYGLNNNRWQGGTQFVISNPDQLATQSGETGYLFHNDLCATSEYHIQTHTSQLQYQTGDARYALSIHPIGSSGEFTFDANDRRLKWLGALVNFRETSVIRPWQILVGLTLYALFILNVMISMGFVSKDHRTLQTIPDNKRNLFLFGMVLVNLLVYLLVAIRWIMVWRISVFPPLDIPDSSMKHFNLLRYAADRPGAWVNYYYATFVLLALFIGAQLFILRKINARWKP
jgi:hypothetical protein